MKMKILFLALGVIFLLVFICTFCFLLGWVLTTVAPLLAVCIVSFFITKACFEKSESIK